MRSQQRKVGIAWFTTPSAVLSSKMNKLVAKKKDDLRDRPVGANLSNVKHGPTPVDLSFSRSTTALLTDQGSSAALRQPNPVHRECTCIVISQHSAISISHISSVVQTRAHYDRQMNGHHAMVEQLCQYSLSQHSRCYRGRHSSSSRTICA